MTPARYFICAPIAILLCGLAVPSQSQLRFDSGNFAITSNANNQPLLLAMTQSPHRAPSSDVIEEPIPIEDVIPVAKLSPSKSDLSNVKPKVTPKKVEPKAIKPKIDNEKKIENKSKQVTEAQVQPKKTDAGVTQKAVVIENPTFLTKPLAPSYPRIARKRGFEGTALIEVQFNHHGQQLSQIIVKSTGYSVLDVAALSAVEKWQFAIPNELSVTLFTVRVPVRFSLNKS